MAKDLFRREKGTLTPEQMSRVDYIKSKADELLAAISSPADLVNPKLNADLRCLEIATTKLEESIMWAVKGYTNTNKKGE